jgi:hypothetical protein
MGPSTPADSCASWVGRWKARSDPAHAAAPLAWATRVRVLAAEVFAVCLVHPHLNLCRLASRLTPPLAPTREPSRRLLPRLGHGATLLLAGARRERPHLRRQRQKRDRERHRGTLLEDVLMSHRRLTVAGCSLRPWLRKRRRRRAGSLAGESAAVRRRVVRARSRHARAPFGAATSALARAAGSGRATAP